MGAEAVVKDSLFASNPIGFGAMGISTLSSLWNQFRNGREAKRNERRLLDQNRRLDAIFDKEYNSDVLDTNYAKTALGKIRDLYTNQSKRDESTAAVTGASEEAKVAAKGERANAMSNAVTNLSAFGEQKKDKVLSDYWTKKQIINQQLNQIGNSKIASRMNLTNNLWGATSSLIGMGLLPKSTPVNPNASNNGTEIKTPSNDYNEYLNQVSGQM